jgi:CDGSH-type Zn-finger protein/uncharacterized Fe-S cluster protein YjdI
MKPSPAPEEGKPTGDKVRVYVGKNIDVTYDAGRCTHAAECLRGLSAVFDTSRRPWILPDGASADAVAGVVRKCPSGALHFVRLDGGDAEAPSEQTSIEVTTDGPLYVRGLVQLLSADGRVILNDTRIALCRCGQSRNKPFCDNSHRDSGFNDAGAVADGGAPHQTEGAFSIMALKNGPLLIQGACVLLGAGGQGEFKATSVELCRCGGSGSKPFCDNTHKDIGFRTEDTDQPV